MKAHLVYLAIFLCILFQGRAQDLMFSNTNQSLIYLNPSFAGSNGYLRLQTTYRNQWPNVTARNVTYYSSADAYIEKLKGGLAVSAMLDDQSHGTLKTNVVDIVYAQHFSLSDKKLKISPSIQVSVMQRRLDIASLNFGDPIDARYGVIWRNPLVLPTNQKNTIDFSSGLLVNYANFFGGVAVKHLTRPDIGLYGVTKLPTLVNVHTSWNKTLDDKTLLQIFVLYTNQESYNTVQMNVNTVLLNNFILGAGYRSTREALFNLGFKGDFGSFMLGYDHVYGQLIRNFGQSVWTVAFMFAPKDSEDKKGFTSFEAW